MALWLPHLFYVAVFDLSWPVLFWQLRVKRSDTNLAKRGRDSFQLRVRKNMVDKSGLLIDSIAFECEFLQM